MQNQASEKRTVEQFWQDKLHSEIHDAVCKYVGSCRADPPRKRDVIEKELALAQANIVSTLLAYDRWQRTLWQHENKSKEAPENRFVG